MDENVEPTPESVEPATESAETPQQPRSSEPTEQPTEQPTENEPNKDACLWATLCHLASLTAFLGIPLGNVLGPLIIWLIKKDVFPFVERHGKEALNFQISIVIYCLAATPLMCLAGLGVFVIAALAIIDVIFLIIAAVSANKGQEYRYPICIRFIK